jgi:eukaryotic-like serine/threonine-protein kinase
MAANDRVTQICPACGAMIDTSAAEPLLRIPCPKCGEKMRVERAFNNFVLVETLGIGGMGTVYKARDTLLDRLVALKLLRKDLGEEADYGTRLQQEARAAALVNHPNVIQVFSSGMDHDQFYLVMELVDHGSLDDLIEQRKRLPEEQVLEAGIQVAKGLRAAHAKGLIHRDVKPANILFADEHTAKIGDFGLAGVAAETLETRGEIWGTPYYVAPERLDNKPEDFRSDIYSLGATLFHATAGRAPIEGETNSATALRELKNKPLDVRSIAPDVSAATARIFHRMLAPEPAQRFSSYDELVAELHQAQRELTGAGEGGGRKGIALRLIGATLLIAAAIAVGLYFFGNKFKPRTASNVTAPSAPAVPIADLEKQFANARHDLLIGHHKVAHAAFAHIAMDVKGRQPLYDWLLLNQGLAALVGREKSQARQAFQDVENAGEIGFDKSDAGLAKFFVATSKAMSAQGVIRAGTAAQKDGSGFEVFALLLSGLKDIEQGDVTDAIPWLEQFLRAQPGGKFAWIADYKPVAQKYLDDARLYADWKKEPRDAGNTAQLSANLEKLRAIRKQLKTHTTISDELNTEEKSFSSRVADQQKAENASRDQERRKILAREAPLWNVALLNYKEKIALYDFAGARDAINAAKVSETSLRAAQGVLQKKTQWLADWKNKLIDDINRDHFAGTITDVSGAQYTGIESATAQNLGLKIPYGSALVPWTKLAPKTLLAVATSFIKPNTTDAADRQWLSAVFADESGQSDLARSLAEAAAKAKPQYHDQVAALFSPTPAPH